MDYLLWMEMLWMAYYVSLNRHSTLKSIYYTGFVTTKAQKWGVYVTEESLVRQNASSTEGRSRKAGCICDDNYFKCISLLKTNA